MNNNLNLSNITQSKQKAIFSKKLNYYINLAGKQQIDVAKDLQIKATTLNSWCKGVSIPEPSKIRKLANYFGIHFADLIDDKTISYNDIDLEQRLLKIITEDTRLKKIIINYYKLSKYQQNLLCDFFENFIFLNKE